MSIIIPAGTPLYSTNVHAGWNFNLRKEHSILSDVVQFPYDLELKSVGFFRSFLVEDESQSKGFVVESTGSVFLSDKVLNDAQISDTTYIQSVIPAETDLYGMYSEDSIVFSPYYKDFVSTPDVHYKTTQKLIILSEKPSSRHNKEYDGWADGWCGKKFVLNNHTKLTFVKKLRN